MGLRDVVSDVPQLFIAQNYYVVCRKREPVERIAKAIGRKTGIYWRDDFQCWALRIKLKAHKQAVIKVFREEIADPKWRRLPLEGDEMQ